MGKPKSVPENRYLQLRGQTWYVRVAVPPSLVRKAGRASVIKSLQTRDVAEARSRRWAMVAKIKAELDELKGAKTWCPVELGLKWRARIAAADDEPDERLHGHSERDLLSGDLQVDIDELEAAGRPKDAYRLYQIATQGGDGVGLADAAERWLKEIEGRLAEQTIRQHAYALRLLKEALPDALLTTDVDRRKAGKFVMDTLQRSGRAQRPSTGSSPPSPPSGSGWSGGGSSRQTPG
jgi:hypothetical protein